MKSMENKHHPLDELFRQGLNDTEIKPTETGRSAFLENVGRELDKRSGRLTWIRGTGIILGIVILAGAIWIISGTGEKQDNRIPDEKIKTGQISAGADSKITTTSSARDIMDRENAGTVHQQHGQIHPVQQNSVRISPIHTVADEALTGKEEDENSGLNPDPSSSSAATRPLTATAPPLGLSVPHIS